MCNAWNHPASCTCGWGGEGHLGRRCDAVPSVAGIARLGTRVASYTIPNARCPLCAADVFFYVSPDGGRVFFDELGPPWPKHPCTVADEAVPLAPHRARNPRSAAALAALRWRCAGWRPFIIESVRTLDRGLFVLTGSHDKVRKAIYLPMCDVDPGAAVRFWPDGLWHLRAFRGQLQVSGWTVGVTHGVHEAYRSERAARDAMGART